MKSLEIIKFANENQFEMLDIKFVDLFGVWQHFSVPVSSLSPSVFEDGFGFDGSSIRGWKAIQASDMVVMPDLSTATADPFITSPKTMSMIADIVEPTTRGPYSRDPRYVARKCMDYVRSTGVADMVYVGPEPEFYIFDELRYTSAPQHSFYEIESSEGAWTTGSYEESPNTAYKVRHKGGYFPVSPTDATHGLRLEMVSEMQKVGLEIEREHHEVGSAGQAEIDFRFKPLVEAGDAVMWLKHVAKNVARRHGKVVTFMPKPLYGDAGSGMHVHQSLWKDGKPLFAGQNYGGLSEMALHYIGGIIKHASAICAFTNATTNSYKRLIPGFEAPVRLSFSLANRSAAIRIPNFSPSPKARRIEVRFPDPLANPYLAFSAIAMAGMDGVLNRIDPGQPLDKDIYGMKPEELAGVPVTPPNLESALQALEADHDFLMRGDVFTEDLLETWTTYKREKEIWPLSHRPHPMEFEMYHDG